MTESELDGIYLWGLRATRAEVPTAVYTLSFMNRSLRHATIMSSEMGDSLERSVTASRRWWMVDWRFIVDMVAKQQPVERQWVVRDAAAWQQSTGKRQQKGSSSSLTVGG